MKPRYYECGCCGCFHAVDWDGDCRDDHNRFNPEDLNAMFGPRGWEDVPQPGIETAHEIMMRHPGHHNPIRAQAP